MKRVLEIIASPFVFLTAVIGLVFIVIIDPFFWALVVVVKLFTLLV